MHVTTLLASSPSERSPCRSAVSRSVSMKSWQQLTSMHPRHAIQAYPVKPYMRAASGCTAGRSHIVIWSAGSSDLAGHALKYVSHAAGIQSDHIKRTHAMMPHRGSCTADCRPHQPRRHQHCAPSSTSVNLVCCVMRAQHTSTDEKYE